MFNLQNFKRACILIVGIMLVSFVGFYAQTQFGQAGVEFIRDVVKWVCICMCGIDVMFKAKESNDKREIVYTTFKYLVIYTIALIASDAFTDIFSSSIIF